jgi:uncharacterized protein (TIGR02145 family)
VTVTGVDDADPTNETVTISHTIAGNVYAAVTSADVTATVTDAGVVEMTAGGVTYSTVTIDTQIWTAKNMRHDASAGNTYTYVGDSADEVVTYGKLYDWAAAMEGSTTERAQGICAAGWHVPSDQDWKDLENHLGMSNADQEGLNRWRGTDQGTQLKEAGTSDLEVKIAGYRSTGGSSDARGGHTLLWSSTESGGAAYSRHLEASKATVNRRVDNFAYGFSVRCLKD